MNFLEDEGGGTRNESLEDEGERLSNQFMKAEGGRMKAERRRRILDPSDFFD
jgi:hypothetical protein